MQTITLYEQDFYAWTQQQTELLRSGKWELLDIDNLIEEIESLGKQQRQELRNRLSILLGHLLKWHYQPEARSRSWWATIREQRREIAILLKENPSLKPYLNEAITLGFENGMDLALRETPIPLKFLPASCPFSIEDIFEQPIEFDED
ncbi:DUF29 domain-containing protein [Myxacorys almedinensis]|uniref:DUF29 family protein n=1 Tax=Myxacorys almedinensis A TaxID=2690445 RepID=A0A8J7Z608_9CYAN|nr:DUF29 domain-containing protein [Myxacorys almedinensis]NDJ18536.1 DUF29 family protein [Myxacorys almedinensis A]